MNQQLHSAEHESGAAPPHLVLYVEPGCAMCASALELFERARLEWSGLDADVVDVAQHPEDRPPEVFAVPTLILDGQVVSLGTPSWDDLAARLGSAFAKRGADDESTDDHRPGDPRGEGPLPL